MLNVILYQPEIPPNTGNIIRLCANTGFKLHLIQPLGFFFDDDKLKRASMDYSEISDIQIHPNLEICLTKIKYTKLYALTTKGRVIYSNQKYNKNTALIFGPESRGLPQDVLDLCDQKIKIPMLTNTRSLNLANSVAIVVYEAWRQNGFQ
ncbi:MAG: tRNA (cytidine(34)-2'-O)-methyltransferase [Legionellales bacterium]|nr:tRNA (cytidine(34)-2'-O)-methyltransferase [Legionellales bacterium]